MGPFCRCTTKIWVDSGATQALREAKPLGRFNILGTYTNRTHLALRQWARLSIEAWPTFSHDFYNLPCFMALLFTLTTACAHPFGFAIAPAISFSLLLMTIAPLVGSPCCSR